MLPGPRLRVLCASLCRYHRVCLLCRSKEPIEISDSQHKILFALSYTAVEVPHHNSETPVYYFANFGSSASIHLTADESSRSRFRAHDRVNNLLRSTIYVRISYEYHTYYQDNFYPTLHIMIPRTLRIYIYSCQQLGEKIRFGRSAFSHGSWMRVHASNICVRFLGPPSVLYIQVQVRYECIRPRTGV